MDQCVWCSWSLPHTDFRLCPMPALQVRAACSPQPGHYSWGRRCSSGVHYPWRCWWLGAAGTGTRSHHFLYRGSLSHKTHQKSLVFRSWDSAAAAANAGIDQHLGLLSRSITLQWSAQEFILLHSIDSKFMRHIRVRASRSERMTCLPGLWYANGHQSINRRILQESEVHLDPFWICNVFQMNTEVHIIHHTLTHRTKGLFGLLAF